ncbi:biogenesis of lysosome-related organelles complex 1 subunit 3 [Aplysia californica]|uniref:Biogenesis of lysosome-related organelles complex 1 subunit 3 n=1 Tax=Aplysia californica TaxID=6500 RepID=A0ABM1A043_APLCA|nr:biogenesis of lysosome-related organelles complex 1 subunit 3 [Aplysia californica]
MESQYKTVVQGEASESDEEEELSSSSLSEPRAVVVEGEASESEEEELDSSGKSIPPALPPIKSLNEHSSSYESIDSITNVPTLAPRQAWKPKYDTVLNRKLWESNLSLCNNANGIASQAYLSAAKDITNCAQQLSKSHGAIQDVSHNLRLLTNDLFNLDDRTDIIISCKLLPDIQLPQGRRTVPPASQQAAGGPSDTSQQASDTSST